MIDEDFYIEESSPLKVFLTSLFILFILGIIGGVYYFYFYYEDIKLKNINIELGDKLNKDVNSYIKGTKNYDYELDVSKVSIDEEGNTNSIGEYSYIIITSKEEKKGKIYVKDTTPPKVELKELTVGINEEFEPDEFVESCYDLSEVCYVNYEKESDEDLTQKVGEYTVALEIRDKHNNKVTKKIKLIVSENASLNGIKSSDMEISNIYPVDSKWNNTFTVKFEKGLSEEDEKFERKILELTNIDFGQLNEEKIKNQTLLTIYNKYNYVIGFSIKLEYENKNIIYVTENDFNNIENND